MLIQSTKDIIEGYAKSATNRTEAKAYMFDFLIGSLGGNCEYAREVKSYMLSMLDLYHGYDNA